MFVPYPNQQIIIDHEEYSFEEHPQAPGIAYAAEGRKATVFKLKKTADDAFFALKVFKQTYRTPELLVSLRALEKLGSWDGLRVCKRKYITSENNADLVAMYTELEYAVLMPWVEGHTWFDLIQLKAKLTYADSLKLAEKMLSILTGLEEAGYAHCDLSSGNVIVGCDVNASHEIRLHDPLWLELIDVEDMYGPGLPGSSAYPKGTDGYQHPTVRSSSKGQWCREGDRFSGAILVSELLSWYSSEIRQNAYEESYFFSSPLENQNNSTRYQLLRSTLKEMGGAVRDCLDRAWNSSELPECPSLVEWQTALLHNLTAYEKLQRQLRLAMELEDDSQILRFAEQIREINKPLSKHEWEAYLDALCKAESKQKLKQALNCGDEIEILVAFSQIDAQEMSADLQHRACLVDQHVQLSIPLKRAIAEEDDKAICELFDPALLDRSLLLSEKESRVVEQTLQRQEMLQSLRSTFGSQNSTRTVHPDSLSLLENSNLLTYDDLQQLDFDSSEESQPRKMDMSFPSPSGEIVSSLPEDENEVLRLWYRGKLRADQLTSDLDRDRLQAAIERRGKFIRLQRRYKKK